MKFGLVEVLAAIRLFVSPNGNYAELKAPTNISANYTLRLPAALPGSTQALVSDASGNLSFTTLGGGGTVTSVALSLPTIFSVAGSPVTSTGTLTGTLANQTAGLIFASPASGAAAAPSFRAIAFTDISALVGTGSSNLAAGNDSRFHAQGTDLGTTATSFQLNSGAGGSRLKSNAGVIETRNAADTAYADFVCNNLTVSGTTTTINSNTVNVGDSILTLNSDFTGSSPTENGGIEVQRGTQVNASFIFNEVTDFWTAGLLGSELQLARVYRLAFTNATLVSGVLTITHGLGQQFVQVEISDSTNQRILADNTTYNSTTTATVDLTSFGVISGSWNLVAIG